MKAGGKGGGKGDRERGAREGVVLNCCGGKDRIIQRVEVNAGGRWGGGGVAAGADLLWPEAPQPRTGRSG